MRLDVQKQIDRLLKDIELLPNDINKACIFALNRTADWLKGQTSKDVAREKRIKLKLIRQRIRIARANKNKLNTVLDCDFFGVKAIDLGTPRQDALGTHAGEHFFRHAFPAILKKKELRTGNEKQGIYLRKGRSRFPVKAARLEIFQEASKKVKELLGSGAGDEFEKRFIHEMHRLTGAIL